MNNSNLTDIEIELQAFLGTELGASIAAEIGEHAASLAFLAGAEAQAVINKQLIDKFLNEPAKNL